jgi:hypothetical protein
VVARIRLSFSAHFSPHAYSSLPFLLCSVASDLWFKVAAETLLVDKWSYDGISEGHAEIQAEEKE